MHEEATLVAITSLKIGDILSIQKTCLGGLVTWKESVILVCSANDSRVRHTKKPAVMGGSLRKKVRRLGFEPRTNWLKANCSTNWATCALIGFLCLALLRGKLGTGAKYVPMTFRQEKIVRFYMFLCWLHNKRALWLIYRAHGSIFLTLDWVG